MEGISRSTKRPGLSVHRTGFRRRRRARIRTAKPSRKSPGKPCSLVATWLGRRVREDAQRSSSLLGPFREGGQSCEDRFGRRLGGADVCCQAGVPLAAGRAACTGTEQPSAAVWKQTKRANLVAKRLFQPLAGRRGSTAIDSERRSAAIISRLPNWAIRLLGQPTNRAN
jgi:hypothetical protein